MSSGIIKPTTRLVIVTILGIFLAVLPAGCNGVTKASAPYGKIEAAELTDNEEGLLKSVGVGNYFVFDCAFKDTNNKWLEYRVDSYENGQLKQKGFGGKLLVDNLGTKSGRLVFSISSAGSGAEKWVFSYSNGRNSTSASSTHKEVQANMASTMAGIKEINFKAGQIVPLVVIAKDKDGLSGLSENVLQSEDAMKKALKNDYVYVLRCKFSDKE